MRLAKKADALEAADMGAHKRARLLRPIVYAVAALCAKAEHGAVVRARRARAKAEADRREAARARWRKEAA